MIIFIFITVAVIALTLDYLATRRIFKATHSRTIRAIWLVFIITINLSLIFSTLAIKYLVVDNTEMVMDVASWTLTLYTTITLSKMAFYAGWLPAKRKQSRGLVIGSALGAFVLVQFIVGIVHTRTAITVRHQTIESTSLPESFDGYRIAFFSDMHIGSMLNAERECQRIVDNIAAQKPDLVVFGGDLTHIRHSELTPRIIEILGHTKARDGVIAILGNHDTGVYIKDTTTLSRRTNEEHLCHSIRAMGWQLLRDSTIYIHRQCDSIAVSGVDFSESLLAYKHSFATPEEYNPQPLFDALPDGIFNICVAHLPQLWPKCAPSCDLMLAGHVHATQIKFSCGNISLSPAMLMYKEWSGHYSDGDSHLYITDGIGSVGFNLRLGAKPEITLLELRSR